MRNHGPAPRDRIDEWWNRRSTAGFRRRALVGTSPRESPKDEALEKAPGLRPNSEFARAGRGVKGLR